LLLALSGVATALSIGSPQLSRKTPLLRPAQFKCSNPGGTVTCSQPCQTVSCGGSVSVRFCPGTPNPVSLCPLVCGNRRCPGVTHGSSSCTTCVGGAQVCPGTVCPPVRGQRRTVTGRVVDATGLQIGGFQRFGAQSGGVQKCLPGTVPCPPGAGVPGQCCAELRCDTGEDGPRRVELCGLRPVGHQCTSVVCAASPVRGPTGGQVQVCPPEQASQIQSTMGRANSVCTRLIQRRTQGRK